MSEIAAFDDLFARRFIRIGGTLLVVCVASALAGSLIEKNVPVVGAGTAAIRIIGALLDGFGVGFAPLGGVLFLAGLLQRLYVRTGRAGAIVVSLILITAVVLFLIAPFCWEEKSDDCRSLAQRFSTLF